MRIQFPTFVVAACSMLAANLVPAQPPTPPAPEPTGLVVGSGNFFSPIVADLERAVAFYRDGLGLDVQGAPGNADQNLPLRNMFGLPDARLRWAIARPPATSGGVEIVEISRAGGAPLDRRMQDPGAYTLILFVRDIDAVLARLKGLGAPVVTNGGAPVSVPMGAGTTRMVVVKDPAGHFVEIVQAERAPDSKAPESANVLGVRVRLTVQDVDQAMRLYRDGLGLKVLSAPAAPGSDSAVAGAFGLSGAKYRFGMLQVPTTGLIFEVIEFSGVDRKTLSGKLQDPGSTRIQLQVRDVGATIAALRQFGGVVVSTGGQPLELPVAGDRKIKVGIVREPDNLFVVLIETPPAAASQ